MAVRSHSTACDDGTFMFPKESSPFNINKLCKTKKDLRDYLKSFENKWRWQCEAIALLATTEHLCSQRSHRPLISTNYIKQKKTSEII